MNRLVLIEKEGDPTKINFVKYKKYKCKNCGCEFWMPKDYTDNDYADYDMPDYIHCPTCNTKIYSSVWHWLGSAVGAFCILAIISLIPIAIIESNKNMKIQYVTNEELANSNTAICITIPKTVKWEDYKKELEAVKDGRQEMNFKVPNLPTKIKVGDRCYLCYNGNIIGWMRISSMGQKSFKSTTDGTYWEGNFVSRSGPFHSINPVKCNGFRGFKYLTYYGDKIVLDDK